MLFFIESWIDKIKLAKLNTRTVIRLKTHDRLTSGRGHDLAIDLFKLVMPISITNNISNCRRARRGVYARRGEMKLPRVYPRRACLGVKGIHALFRDQFYFSATKQRQTKSFGTHVHNTANNTSTKLQLQRIKLHIEIVNLKPVTPTTILLPIIGTNGSKEGNPF